MAIVDTTRTLPEWAKFALQKIERMTQEAATAEKHGNVVTLECVATMIRENATVSAPEASGADYVMVQRMDAARLAEYTLDAMTPGDSPGAELSARRVLALLANPAPPTSGECVHKYGSAIRHVCVRCGFDALAQPTPADESGAECIGDVCGLAKRTGVTCAEGECDKLAGVRTAEPRAAAQDGCGACGDGCAKRGACRLAEESPKAAAQEDDRPVAEVGHYINQGFTLAIVSVCWDRLKAGDKLYLQPSGAAEDAARYRWLRTVTPYRFKQIQEECIADTGDTLYFLGDKFDAAIDAARRARGEG